MKGLAQHPVYDECWINGTDDDDDEEGEGGRHWQTENIVYHAVHANRRVGFWFGRWGLFCYLLAGVKVSEVLKFLQ